MNTDCASRKDGACIAQRSLLPIPTKRPCNAHSFRYQHNKTCKFRTTTEGVAGGGGTGTERRPGEHYSAVNATKMTLRDLVPALGPRSYQNYTQKLSHEECFTIVTSKYKFVLEVFAFLQLLVAKNSVVFVPGLYCQICGGYLSV